MALMRSTISTILLLAVLMSCHSSGCGSVSSVGRPLPQPLSALYPIDGVVDFSAFSNVQHKTVNFISSRGTGTVVKSTTLSWVVLNDDRDIYIAVEWTDDTYDHDYDISLGPTNFDGVKLLFDNDGDGKLDVGEDERTVLAASVSSDYMDQHVVTSGDETDIVQDGLARLSYDAVRQKYQAEFLFPMQADVYGQDANLTTSTRYAIMLFDHVQPGVQSGNVAINVDSGSDAPGTDTSSWPGLPLVATGPHAHPQIPAGLTGLIAFISTHENPTNGEIYTFNPATGLVTRVTDSSSSSLFKDNLSLSHDRKRIAFHGATNQADYTTYEIYIVDVNGQNLHQITHNSVLDGHPGWSPDDSKIVYATLNPAKNGRASIVIANADGSNAQELSPLDADDNDPDFLPDGRIVFKTLRGSTYPLYHIAVMDADGSNVQFLTPASTTSSDHDPVGNSSVAVFERFLKPTDYNTDVEAQFTPWDIVEARLDGSGERTLLHNGWINWLPVFDPTNQYLVYLRSASNVDAQLMTKDGKELGRLIPNMTQMWYIDWK